jgi:hypothetical protein
LGLLAPLLPLLAHCSAPSPGGAAEPASSTGAQSSSSASPSASSPSASSPSAAPPGRPNAVVLPDGGLLALERFSTAGAARAFRLGAGEVEVYDEKAERVGTVAVGPSEGSALFGGFDIDGDGVVDFGITRSVSTGVKCGASTMNRTRVDLYSTATGSLWFSSPEEDDKCWTFPTATYPTQQWTALSALFGETPGRIALSTYYASTGTVVSLSPDHSSHESTFFYPSNPAYATYAAAQVNAHGGTKYYENSHVANGLFVRIGAEERLVFFTSARVVQYAADGGDLLADAPFLPGNRADLVGRNYGLVAVDPGAPSRLVLLNGTPAQTLFADQLASAMTTDPWGGIERHVALYDVATGSIVDRFFSYAHDHDDGDKFQGRVSYPDHPWLSRGSGPSRIVYGVYDGGHWYTHVSSEAGVDDTVVVRGLVPWDVRDIDGDGIEEVIASPTELPGDPDVPGYYFTKWKTTVLRWSEDQAKLVELRSYDGIPELVPSFRTTTTTTTSTARYPVAVVQESGRSRLVLRNQAGERILLD